MSAYLIEVDDTKQGVVYPTIIGPFPDYAAALTFRETHDNLGTAAQGGQGGYSECHIVCDDTCDYTPAEYADKHPADDDDW